MSSAIPAISVVMAVYNGEKYLRESIDSILGQTYSDFEFIIVDDCSTDSTPAILAEYANSDQRVRVLRNDTNLQMSKSLNVGIAAACGEYIARQDADDVSLPTRFQRQIEFLHDHPDTLALGTGIIIIDEDGRELGTSIQPRTDLEIKWNFLSGRVLTHTTVFVARSALMTIGGYPIRPDLSICEDAACWARIARLGKLAGIPEPLAKYRLHAESMTSANSSSAFWADVTRFMRESFAYILGEPVDDSLWNIWTRFAISPFNPPFTLAEVRTLSDLLPKLTAGFYSRYDFDLGATKAHRRHTHLKWARRALGLARKSHPERNVLVRLRCVLVACKLTAIALGVFRRFGNPAAHRQCSSSSQGSVANASPENVE